MKKKTTEISTNASSGAEKVEVIEKELKKNREGTKKSEVKSVAKTREEPSAKAEAAVGAEESDYKKTEKISAKQMNAQSSSGKAEKESAAAKARVEAALKRKEAQQKRKEERAKRTAEKKAARAKRMAERKARIEKRAAEKKALVEKRAAQQEERRRERAHSKANKNRAQAKKKTEKQRKKKNDGNERNKGYGGWLAAVISLGAVTLALTAAVTVGAIDMKKNKDMLAALHRGGMYELTGIMENVDDDLDRIRVSASPVQQSRILTDLLVQARLAELDLEKLPIPAESDRNVTTFVNRTAAECERMLAKLRLGETLSKEDIATLNRLYEVNHSIRMELNKLMQSMTDKDLMDYMKEGMGGIKDALNKLEELTLEENRAMINRAKDKMTGAGMSSMPDESNTKDVKGIDPSKAEELCKTYFSDYKITNFQCIGETVSQSFAAYNVQGYDDKGTLLFAELSQKDGALLRFDYYEDCSEDTFDLDDAEEIAEEFLEKLGYDDMEVVRFRENGTMIDFTFVYEDDDVAYYPDEIRVKVCRSRGVVTGMDATKFLQNHKKRTEPKIKLTMTQAADKLYDGLKIESARLAVVKAAGGERAAYEFVCSYQKETYFIYLDAMSGEEIAIVNAKSVG